MSRARFRAWTAGTAITPASCSCSGPLRRVKAVGSTRTDSQGVFGEGHVILKNGRKVAFSFRLPDERSGTAVVDGSEAPPAAWSAAEEALGCLLTAEGR